MMILLVVSLITQTKILSNVQRTRPRELSGSIDNGLVIPLCQLHQILVTNLVEFTLLNLNPARSSILTKGAEVQEVQDSLQGNNYYCSFDRKDDKIYLIFFSYHFVAIYFTYTMT